MEMSYAIAYAASQDEGNRSMRKAGRTRWNEEDRDAACRTYHRLMRCPQGVGCMLCEPEPNQLAASGKD